MKISLTYILFFFSFLQLSAQEKFIDLRKEYSQLLEKNNYDSALSIAYRTKIAATKEFGINSPNYLRATNSIGHCYLKLAESSKENFIDSARFWLNKTYQQLQLHPDKAYDLPRIGVLQNLADFYTKVDRKIDSVFIYTDSYLALQKKEKLSPNELIYDVIEHAADIEQNFNLEAAAKYYGYSLELRTNYFGKFSTEIVKDLDSILRTNSETNNANRRFAIYKVFDEQLPLKEFQETVDEHDQVGDLQDYFDYLSGLNDELIRLDGGKGMRVAESLQKLGRYYLNWYGDKDFARYYFEAAKQLITETGKTNSKIFAEVQTLIKGLNEAKTLTVSKEVVFEPGAEKNLPTATFKQPDLRLMLPIGHPQGITNAGMSSNGKFVYSKSFNDVNIKIWDVATGALIYNLPMVGTPNFGVFIKDNYIFATSNKQCVLWDLKDGTKKWEKFLSTGVNIGLAVNQEKQLILTDHNQNLFVLQAETGAIISSFKLNEEILNLSTKGVDQLLVETKAAALHSLYTLNYQTGALTSFIIKKDFQTAFSPQNLCVIYPSNAATYDIESLRLISSFPVDSGSNGQFLSAKGNKLLLTYNKDTTRAVYNTMTGSLVSNYNYQYIPQNFSFIGNGNFYLTHDGLDAGIWNSQTGELIGVMKGDSTARVSRNVDGFFQFSADQKYMLVAYTDNVLRLWDVSAEKPFMVRSFEGKTSALYVTTFSDDKKFLATKDNENYIKVIDLKANKLLGTVEHKTFSESAIIFDHINKQMITSSDSTIRFWEFPSLKLKKEIKYLGIRSLDVSKDNKYLLTASLAKGEVRIWNLMNYSYDSLKIDSVNSAKFNLDNDKILISRKEVGISILDAKSKEVLKSAKIPEWDYLTEYSNKDQYILHLTGQSLRIFDGNNLSLINQFELDNEVNTVGVAISPDGKQLLTGEHSGKLVVYDIKTKEIIREKIMHTAGFQPELIENERLITCSDDGTIKVWNYRTLDLLYQIVPFGESDFVIYARSGYYTASPQASKYLNYVSKNLDVIGFEQLDVKYNRPDKVFAEIGGTDQSLINLYEKAYLKRIKKLGIDTTSLQDGFVLPQADFADREKIALDQKNQQLNLKIKGNDGRYPLKSFNIWINDIPLFGSQGKPILGKRKELDTTITISLSQGKNTIETSVSNTLGIESFKKPLVILYNPSTVVKEKVWFVGIGIGDFKDVQHNLNWSTADITNLDRELKAKFKENYHSTLLLNRDVSKQKIQAIKKMLQDSTSINDKVILSFSGHGLMSKNFDYYLSTYDTDFEHPEKQGLPYELVENILDSIPARKKLMLIDACYSGEIDKDEIKKGPEGVKKEGQKGTITLNYSTSNSLAKNPFELMQLLFNNINRSTGAVIISASAGNQSAQEKSDLKSGVFTYSVLEMLTSNKPFKISDFKKQISRRVIELSKGTQVPTIRGDSKNYDWELW